MEHTLTSNLKNKQRLKVSLNTLSAARYSKIKDSIEELNKLYTIDNIDSVQNFLENHINLYEVLSDVYIKIKDVFGKDIKELYLEHFIDPEEDFQCICITVITELSVDKQIELRNEFYEKYWLDQDVDIRTLVSVMV
jgi:hypothetical protein